jgi:hypothetical protein
MQCGGQGERLNDVEERPPAPSYGAQSGPRLRVCSKETICFPVPLVPGGRGYTIKQRGGRASGPRRFRQLSSQRLTSIRSSN